MLLLLLYSDNRTEEYEYLHTVLTVWYLLSLRRRLVIMQQAPFRLLRMTWALGAATPRGNVGRMSWFGTGGGVGRTRELRCSAGSPPPRVNLYGLSDVALKGLLKDWQQPAFRAKQVRQWVYEKGSTSYDSMMNLPKDLRTKLSEHTTLGELRIAQEQLSKDGTQKRLWECADGSLIESVLMPYDTKRRTACISSQAWRAWRAWQGMEGMEGMAGHGRAWQGMEGSALDWEPAPRGRGPHRHGPPFFPSRQQVGCAMGCTFCATGQMGFKRDLTEAEIFEQAARFASELQSRGERLSNVV